MDMDNAKVVAVGVGDDELGDGILAHHLEGIDGILGVENGAGIGVHDVGGKLGHVTGLHHTTKVAVGDNACDTTFFCNYSASETLGGHLDDSVGDGRRGSHFWSFILDVKVSYAKVELLAESTARMEASEVASREVSTFDEGNRKGIAHDKLSGSGRGWGQIVGAGLMGNGGIEHDIGLVGEERVSIADDGDKGVSEILDERYEDLDFWSVSGLGDADDDIAGTDHTEVAVDGIGSMEEECRSACGIKGGDNLDGNVSTFADTRHHHASRGRKNDLDSFGKALVNVICEIFDSFFFIANYLDSNIFYLFSTLHNDFFFVDSIFLTTFVKQK